MLGGLAYQSPDYASIKNLDLRNIAKINAEIADTAVDVFVYDTSKDSDGGAWRQRTHHTSWYNEPLNTRTRGSRREFPAVAVIVAQETNNQQVVIYDGDDPDLPMWMVFERGGNNDPFLDGSTPGASFLGNYAPTSVSAFNGIICAGCWRSAGALSNLNAGLRKFSFIEDNCIAFNNSNTYKIGDVIANRNVITMNQIALGGGAIVNVNVRDVAITVLPNAPIDDNTGLPIPTIAVGTDGGVSVIKDDGTIISTSGSSYIHKVEFTDDRGLNAIISNTGNANYAGVYVNNFNTLNGLNYGTYNNWDGIVYITKYDPKALTYKTANVNDIISEFIDLENRSSAISVSAVGGGLTLLEKSPKDLFDPDSGMVAFVTSDYNTGYLQGDIKGAFLSDTDTTNAVGTELHPNGNSNFSSTDVSYISNTASGTATVTNGQLVLSGGTSNYSDHIFTVSNLEVGAQYIITIDYIAKSTGAGSIGFYVNGAYLPEINDGNGYNVRSTGKSYSFYFTTEFSSRTIDLVTGGGTSITHTFDNWSIKKVEEDRSANNNGLQVYGTVPKSAVETGADLVSYGGFSTSNYLRQPYNSDLRFEKNDFSIMFWIYDTGVNEHTTIISKDEREFDISRLGAAFGNKLRIYTRNSSEDLRHSDSASVLPFNKWVCVCVVYTGGNTKKVYLDGVLDTTITGTNGEYDIDSTSYGLNIGVRNTGGTIAHAATGAKFALMRISGSAPSEAQIKKIYEDERHLFQENAKSTLYGSSDAVTALAYDDSTSLLHVGTSFGRSDFTGLKRINHTTTAVSTVMSAQDGLIAQQ